MALLRTFLLVSFCAASLLLLAGPGMLRAATMPVRLRIEAQNRPLSLRMASSVGRALPGPGLPSELPRR